MHTKQIKQLSERPMEDLPQLDNTPLLELLHQTDVEREAGFSNDDYLLDTELHAEDFGLHDTEEISTDHIDGRQLLFMSYDTDARGAYPATISKSFLGVSEEVLEVRRHVAFSELSMYCEQRHAELNVNPVDVVVLRTTETCKSYLKHLKRRATRWERKVVQSYFLEHEVRSLYQPSKYSLPKGGRRCKHICLDIDSCKRLCLDKIG